MVASPGIMYAGLAGAATSVTCFGHEREVRSVACVEVRFLAQEWSSARSSLL